MTTLNRPLPRCGPFRYMRLNERPTVEVGDEVLDEVCGERHQLEAGQAYVLVYHCGSVLPDRTRLSRRATAHVGAMGGRLVDGLAVAGANSHRLGLRHPHFCQWCAREWRHEACELERIYVVRCHACQAEGAALRARVGL